MNFLLLPQVVSVECNQRSATVLVVDDYQSMCEMIAAMLRPWGYRVLTASSGEKAQALARENERIDLLLTDLEMPQMRGDELATWFRAATPETRVLFMSTQGVTLPALEPFHFLEKPFSVHGLVTKVREALNPNSSPSAKAAAA